MPFNEVCDVVETATESFLIWMYLFIFACHCVPCFVVTIEAEGLDFFLFEKCLFTNTFTLYCTRRLKTKGIQRGDRVIGIWRKLFSGVCN